MKLPAYPRTKPSGVEWLGDVPEHWNVCAVWHVFSLGRGRVISHEDIRDDPGEYPVYSSQTENDGVLGCLGTYDFEGDYVTWTTDGANAGTVFRRTGKFNCTNVCGTLKATAGERIDTRFAAYALNLATGEFVRHDINPKLMNNVMAKIRFGVASITEQRSIAAFLDRETGRVDQLVAKKRELIERLKEKRSALISRTVTRGLPAEAAAKAGFPINPPLKPSGTEWLGDIPEHWEVKKLQYLFRFTSGGTPPTETAEYWGDDLPWVSPKDMKCFRLSDTVDHVTELALEETSTTAVPAETMLLVARSGILKHSIPVAITTRRMTINQDIKGVIPFRKNLSVYFYAWFIEGHQSELLTEWRKEGATVESLELELIKNCELPFPSISEQAAIAAYLDAETAKLDALVGKVEEAVERLQEYRTALITAAVTGKIDVRSVRR